MKLREKYLKKKNKEEMRQGRAVEYLTKNCKKWRSKIVKACSPESNE